MQCLKDDEEMRLDEKREVWVCPKCNATVLTTLYWMNFMDHLSGTHAIYKRCKNGDIIRVGVSCNQYSWVLKSNENGLVIGIRKIHQPEEMARFLMGYRVGTIKNY